MASQSDRDRSIFGANNAHPRIESDRKDPAVAAVLAKLVSPQNEKHGSPPRNRQIQAPNLGLYQQISDGTAMNIMDATNMVQLLPDLQLAIQILVSSVLSPKDMMSTDLNFTVEAGQFDNELAGIMLEYVRNYFENHYKISDLLPKILEDVLFYKGAYAQLILPENSIDDAINSPERVSLESVSDVIDTGTYLPRPIGLLGNPTTTAASTAAAVEPSLGLEAMFVSTEDYRRKLPTYDPVVKPLGGAFEPMLRVTDNVSVFKVPRLMDKMAQDRLQDVLAASKLSTISTENHRTATRSSSDKSLYRPRRYKAQPVVAITPSSALKRAPIGHPLVLTLPVECVIPVHIPSNPEEHLGYFVLVDGQGNPVVKASEADYFSELSNNLANNSDMASKLLSQARRGEIGTYNINGVNGGRAAEVEELERIYGDLVEQDLQQRLSKGVYGDRAQVARPQEVYRIMLSRAFSRQQTQLVYVPAEMMSYIAFDHNRYGIGTSLLQGSKIIGGMRAVLLFANTMAAIKNSVGRTEIQITLDENDPDPSTTVEFLLNEHARMTQTGFPVGASSARDIVSFLQGAGVEVSVTGNKAYPETKVAVEDKQSNRAKPDPELEKSLKDRQLMSMSLSPETVDAGANTEFATTIVENNLLLAKRVLILQNKLTGGVDDFIHKYVPCSGEMMAGLRELLEDHREVLENAVRANRAEETRRATRRADGRQRDPEARPRRVVNDERGLSTEDRGREAVEHERRKDGRDAAEDFSDIDLDEVILDFVSSLRTQLPSPDTVSLVNQMKAFTAYTEALDAAIKAYMDPAFLDATALGELSSVVDATIAATKAHFIRQWLRNNNVLPELDALTTFSDKDGPGVDLLKSHEHLLEGLGQSVTEFMKKRFAAQSKTNEAMTQAKADNDIDGAGGDVGGDAGGGDSSFGDTDADTTTDGTDPDPDSTGDDGELSEVPAADATDDTPPAEDAGDDAAADADDKKPKPDDEEEVGDLPPVPA